MQGCKLLFKVLPALCRNAVWLSAMGRFHWPDPPTLFQAGNRSIQGSRAEANTREKLDVFHHCVAVLVAVGQACEHEKRWIRHA